MAIAFDTSTSYFSNSGTSHSWSHTTSGTDRILWVNVMNSSGVSISSVTYNGVGMTNAVNSGASQRNTLFYLVNPASGSNTVTVTLASSSYCYTNSASYTGAEQSGQPDATNGQNSSTATLTTSVTTTDDNCWTVLGARQASTGNTSAGTGTTQREAHAGYTQFYDSNAAITPAGSTSLQTTQSASGTTGHAMASFSPAPEAAATENSLAWCNF